jgi:hypothetical protein
MQTLKKLEWRTLTWVEISEVEELRLQELKPDTWTTGVLSPSGKHLHHQDDWDGGAGPKMGGQAFVPKRARPDGGAGPKPAKSEWKCDWAHACLSCKCHLLLNHHGQDEPTCKAFQLTSRVWTMEGVRGLRKKGDGPGGVVSARAGDFLGFGLALFAERLLLFNAWRKDKHGPDAAALTRSPGLRFLKHGQNAEGRWTCDDDDLSLSLQADDVLDLCDWLAERTNRPQQQVGEHGWSGGHSKAQDGGPNAHAFNKGPGGKQTAIRPAVLERDGRVGDPDTEASAFRSPDGTK